MCGKAKEIVSAKNTVETQMRPDRILYTELDGPADELMVNAVREDISLYIGRVDPTDWVIDVTGLEEIRHTFLPALKALMLEFRERNGRHVAFVVSAKSTMRMALSTMSFSIGAKFAVAETLERAVAEITRRARED